MSDRGAATPSGIAAIVDADRAAQREIQKVEAQAEARLRATRDRLERERDALSLAEQARIVAAAAAIERESRERVQSRRAARAAARDSRRVSAAGAVREAVAVYVAVVSGAKEDAGR